MWQLPSGLYAEEILYGMFRRAPKVSLVHSSVIDIHDRTIQAKSTDIDWKAIIATVPKWPQTNGKLVISIKRGFKVTLRDFLALTTF